MKYIDIPIDRARHARIKFELELRGLRLADIAIQLGTGASVISSVSLGKSRSQRIERHLASAIEQSVEELFPERYVQAHPLKESPDMSP